MLLLEPDLVLNFGNLELHELGVGVTFTVKIGEDLYGFGVPFVINEPTWTLRVIVSCMLDDIDEINLLRGRTSCRVTGSQQESSADPREYGRTACH